ncbi:hypothetical protein K3495_g11140 [Podosphaera aphanis]|nr:hypothetical protein K3495_g11140 [Podosphaera aphanis]
MDSHSNIDGIRRPLPTLIRGNRRTWFKELRYWMIEENIFIVFEKDVQSASTTSSDNITKKSSQSTLGYAVMKSELNKIIPPDLDEFKKQKWKSVAAEILSCLASVSTNLRESAFNPLILQSNN